MPKFDDRFARQNRCEPPPEFPLASPYSGIVHHLSGPNIYALTRTRPKTSGPVDGAPCGSHLYSLSFRSWVCHPKTRTYVRLLGPCFKTGHLKPLRQHPKCEGVRRPAQRAHCVPWSASSYPAQGYNTSEDATFPIRFSDDTNQCWLATEKYTKQKPG